MSQGYQPVLEPTGFIILTQGESCAATQGEACWQERKEDCGCGVIEDSSDHPRVGRLSACQQQLGQKQPVCGQRLSKVPVQGLAPPGTYRAAQLTNRAGSVPLQQYQTCTQDLGEAGDPWVARGSRSTRECSSHCFCASSVSLARMPGPHEPQGS